ncbi:MAG: FAD/FMN-dependent dehydrogenase [Herbinix sp.]|jgi:glycolate oxidase|nr:FAD/FMN-dependent dehydrogenase [Herbinix sp.]
MDILKRLRAAVGDDYVSDSKDVCLSYAYSNSITHKYEHIPDLVVQPKTTEEVSMVIKIANEFKVPVTPKGLSSGAGTAGPMTGGILLDLLYMDKVLSVDPINMKATVEAGCSFFKFSQEVFKHGLMTPTTEYTCGPNVAAALISPAVAFGKTRYGRNCEMVEGLEVVLPDGEICHLGSLAYEKSPFGPYYRFMNGPDLIGMYIMSNGAFGIITKMAFTLQKRPAEWKGSSYYWKEKDILKVTEFMLEATAMEVYDIHLNDKWKYDMMTRGKDGVKKPGAYGLLDFYPEGYFFVQATLNAFDKEEIRVKSDQFDRLVAKYGGYKMGDEMGAEFFAKWPTVHHCTHFFKMILSSVYEIGGHNYQYIFDSIDYPTSKYPEVYTKMKGLFEKWGFWGYPNPSTIDAFPMRSQTICSQTWTYINTCDEKMMDNVFRFRDEFREWFGVQGGTHQMHLPPIAPDYAWTNQRSHYQMLQAIKKALDPNNILSPTTFAKEI